MENMESIGAGLASLGFWIFLSILIGSAIWADRRRKEHKLEILKAMIENGQTPDSEMMETLLKSGTKPVKQIAWELKIASVIIFSISIGIGILAFFVGHIEEKALYPILGSAAVVLSVSAGLFLASRLLSRHED